MKRKRKNLPRYGKMKINSHEDIVNMIKNFSLKGGNYPFAIVTSPDNVEVLKKWFGEKPGCISIPFENIPIVTPYQLLLI